MESPFFFLNFTLSKTNKNINNMKHSLHFQKRFLAFFIALIMGTGTAFAAYDFSAVCSTGQTLYYNIIDATNHYVEITCPNTSYPYWEGFTKPTGNITFPSTVTYNGITYTVTKIGAMAFDECDGLTGPLTIPNSVTEIGGAAFQQCNGFTGMLTIGSSVAEVGIGAFSLCTGFTSIKALPETPPILGSMVFQAIPNSIPLYVYCEALNAYHNASGWDAFTNIQRIDNGCDPLIYSVNADGVSVTVTGHMDGTAATGPLTIPATATFGGVTYTVTAIGAWAFYNCEGLTGSLTIPNSVTTIGICAFDGCSGFTGALVIPDGVTTIGNSAFYGCSGFTGSLIIGRSVTTIGNQAFRNCNGFTGSLTIGRSVTSIGSYAFCNCSGFTSITVFPETPPTLIA